MSLWKTGVRAENRKGRYSELGLFEMLRDYSKGEGDTELVSNR